LRKEKNIVQKGIPNRKKELRISYKQRLLKNKTNTFELLVKLHCFSLFCDLGWSGQLKYYFYPLYSFQEKTYKILVKKKVKEMFERENFEKKNKFLSILPFFKIELYTTRTGKLLI
jgi:hypothetical protein